MDSVREILYKAYEHLLSVKGECSCESTNQCGISDLTIRQIEYLKIMDTEKDVTFSKIAALTRTSKPTVSEFINKLIRLDCIYKEPSPTDKRVSYIFLTQKGKGIARIEKTIMLKVVDRILDSLNEKEVTLLIKLFNKVV